MDKKEKECKRQSLKKLNSQRKHTLKKFTPYYEEYNRDLEFHLVQTFEILSLKQLFQMFHFLNRKLKQSFTDIPDPKLLKRQRDFGIYRFCFQEILNMLNYDIHVQCMCVLSDFTNIIKK